MLQNIFKIKQTDRNKFCAYIIESSAPRGDFYFLVCLSALIVALGLMADNVILVIGGMVVAPILSPILALALGVVINDGKVMLRSLRIFFTAFALVFILTLIAGVFFSGRVGEVSLVQIMEPSLFNFFVSLVAGLAASYTWAKPNLDETLPGIAITVTLIPPLVAVGLAVSHLEWVVSLNALKTFLLNVLGITASSLIIFSLMDFYKAKKKLVEEVKEEEKEIKQEKKKNNNKK